jgi:replicative DNA helicase
VIVDSAFKFDKGFQVKILSLMHQDFDFLGLIYDLVKPTYFTDGVLVWYFCTMRDYYLDYKAKIGLTALQNELVKACKSNPPRIKAVDIKAHLEVFQLLSVPVSDKKYIIDEVSTFCRHQAIKEAILSSPELLQKEQYEEIEDIIKKAVAIGVNTMSVGTQFFVDWRERLTRRNEGVQEYILPTGITELDRIIGGGLKSKQLGLWMGPAGRGKSAALSQCAKRAVIGRKKVIHYTLEMSSDVVCERYDASFSGINVTDLREREIELITKLEKYGRSLGNGLLVKEYPPGMASVSMLRAHINQCCGIGFVPDLIVVDYLDLLKPSRRYQDKRDELTATTVDLRGMAVELGLPVWSATQANRGAISIQTHTEEHVSEDIGKINTSDIVITINQTKDEIDDGTMRLFVAKNRNGPRYLEVEIQTRLSRMCFFEPPRG